MVGWTAMVRSKSALVAPIVTAMPTAWMISPASWPNTWTPTTRSLARSTMSFIRVFSARPDSVAFIGRKLVL